MLGYMNLMRLPMALTPKMVGAFVDSLVSYQRLSKFLFQGDEVQPTKFQRLQGDEKFAIKLTAKASFRWEEEEEDSKEMSAKMKDDSKQEVE